MIFERVLLPHPFLPIMAWISPGKTVSETPFKIGRLSVDAERFSTCNIGSIDEGWQNSEVYDLFVDNEENIFFLHL